MKLLEYCKTIYFDTVTFFSFSSKLNYGVLSSLFLKMWLYSANSLWNHWYPSVIHQLMLSHRQSAEKHLKQLWIELAVIIIRLMLSVWTSSKVYFQHFVTFMLSFCRSTQNSPKAWRSSCCLLLRSRDRWLGNRKSWFAWKRSTERYNIC
jgi:hypothetical protein